VAALLIPTELQQNNMAAQLVEIHRPTGRQMRARIRRRGETVNRQESATEARSGAAANGAMLAIVVQAVGMPVPVVAERESTT
jgi:hypothetical protein